MSTVTKRDLAKRISNKTGLSRRVVLEAIEEGLLEITDSLSQGDDVVFRNFGTFQIGINKPKKGRNPKKPEIEIEIPARRVVRFKPGKILKGRVERGD